MSEVGMMSSGFVINHRTTYFAYRREEREQEASSEDVMPEINNCCAGWEISLAVVFLGALLFTGHRFLADLKECSLSESSNGLQITLLCTLIFMGLQALKKLLLALYFNCSKTPLLKRDRIYWKYFAYFCTFDSMACIFLAYYFLTTIGKVENADSKYCLNGRQSVFYYVWSVAIWTCMACTCFGCCFGYLQYMLTKDRDDARPQQQQEEGPGGSQLQRSAAETTLRLTKTKHRLTTFFQQKKRNFGKASDKAKETETCAICQEVFNDDSAIAELNCSENHIFHADCLKTWFEQQKRSKTEMTCPMCRKTVKLGDNGVKIENIQVANVDESPDFERHISEHEQAEEAEEAEPLPVIAVEVEDVVNRI